MFELARRVLGVDVDHHIARAQQAQKAHRELQQIGHHQRHSATFGKLEHALKISRHLARAGVELAKQQPLARGAAHKSRPVRMQVHRVVEVIGDGAQGVGVNLRGYALRVASDPDGVHRLDGVDGGG